MQAVVVRLAAAGTAATLVQVWRVQTAVTVELRAWEAVALPSSLEAPSAGVGMGGTAASRPAR